LGEKAGRIWAYCQTHVTPLVKPYVKTNKHDMADAEAVCEAVSRPNMRFVPIKNVEATGHPVDTPC